MNKYAVVKIFHENSKIREIQHETRFSYLDFVEDESGADHAQPRDQERREYLHNPAY